MVNMIYDLWFILYQYDLLTKVFLLVDKSLSGIIFSFLWTSFHDSTTLTVIEYFPDLSFL